MFIQHSNLYNSLHSKKTSVRTLIKELKPSYTYLIKTFYLFVEIKSKSSNSVSACFIKHTHIHIYRFFRGLRRRDRTERDIIIPLIFHEEKLAGVSFLLHV